jgi:hypothetical protein
MKYRKLRIAWSVGCGVLCLLLIASWVRSYSYSDELRFNIAENRSAWLNSVNGDASMFTIPVGDPLLVHGPAIFGERIERPFPTHGFSFSRKSVAWNVPVPLWCPVLIFAALSTAPWLRRFSLRTLLIGMTLVALALGFIVALSR